MELLTGTPQAGIAHAESALWITQTTDQPQLTAKALSMLATLEAAAGLRDRAGGHARQALDLHRRFGQRLWETRTQQLLDNLQDESESNVTLVR